jgi:HAD superfamily hydrolase (TIGR01509 family)
MRSPDPGPRRLPRPQGVVFDMDGLLLDSERLAMQAFCAAAESLGWAPDLDVYRRCIGSTYAATEALLSPLLPADVPYAELDRRWSAQYDARIEAGELAVKPGAFELLRVLAQRGIPRALATSTRRAVAARKLALTGLGAHLEVLVCGGETGRGKPHPDPYLQAVALLGVAPALAWACEDSDNGVRSAHGAGLHVIQVPDLVPPSAEVRAFGHLVAADLFEVLEHLERA